MFKLDPRMRRSAGARIAALGFIVFVIFGNLWIARSLSGGSPLSWIGVGFLCGIVAALGGGLWLLTSMLRRKLRGEDSIEIDEPGTSESV